MNWRLVFSLLFLFLLAVSLTGCQSTSATTPTVCIQPTLMDIASSHSNSISNYNPRYHSGSHYSTHLYPSPTETPLPTLTSTIEAVHYGPDRFPKDIDPFTGLKVDDPSILDRRPVMVKVSNFPPSAAHNLVYHWQILFSYITSARDESILSNLLRQQT
jgi:hypothetical protein